MIRILVCLILLMSVLTACENDLAEVKAAVSKDEIAIEKAKNVEMIYSDSALVKVRIKGSTLLRHLDKSNPREEFPDGVIVEFFGPNQRIQSTLIANYAIRYESKKEIVVRDSVVWHSKNKETLETEELIWDERKERVYSNKFVKITKPEEQIWGYGFEADQDFTRWEINALVGKLKVDAFKDELGE